MVFCVSGASPLVLSEIRPKYTQIPKAKIPKYKTQKNKLRGEDNSPRSLFFCVPVTAFPFFYIFAADIWE
jgi:hypothetical protein